MSHDSGGRTDCPLFSHSNHFEKLIISTSLEYLGTAWIERGPFNLVYEFKKISEERPYDIDIEVSLRSHHPVLLSTSIELELRHVEVV